MPFCEQCNTLISTIKEGYFILFLGENHTAYYCRKCFKNVNEVFNHVRIGQDSKDRERYHQSSIDDRQKAQ